VLGVLYRWAESGWSEVVAVLWALLQSSVVPGPSDAVLVPLGLADPKKALPLAFWTIVGSTIGALIAYWIGAAAYDSIGLPLLNWLGVGNDQIARIEAMFAQRGWLVIAFASLPLLPSKGAGIIAGAFGLPVAQFIAVNLTVRGGRFLITGLLLRFAGGWMAKRVGRLVPGAGIPERERDQDAGIRNGGKSAS
jgi:membrane protein YqaA with SNARE-associated domain